MPKTICHECKKVIAECESLQQARANAVLHYKLTPHLICFGYSDAEAEEVLKENQF